MDDKYSIGQVVQFTLNILNGISIPAVLAETVGVPIAKAIGNLNAIAEAIRTQEEEGAKDGREADPE